MRPSLLALFFISFATPVFGQFGQDVTPGPIPEPPASPGTTNPAHGELSAAENRSPLVTLPAGTKISLAVTSPIWMRDAAVGHAIYAEVSFPVAENNQMLVPAGTFVQGQISSLTLPHLLTPHSEIHFRFTKMVFPNGYTVDLSDAALIPANPPSGTAASSPGMAAAPRDFVPAVANVTVSVTTR